MIHKVFCFECNQQVELDIAGDLSQYTGDTINCPCDDPAVVVPKPIGEGKMGLFHIADLEPPKKLIELWKPCLLED